MLPNPSPSYMLPDPSLICSPTLLKNKKKELMLHPSPICSPYLIKSEGVREVNDGHEQPLVRLGLYLHSQQRANSVSNESQPPSPPSTAQPYTPHSSFTHQAVQTRNAKSGGSSRTSWRPTFKALKINITVIFAQGFLIPDGVLCLATRSAAARFGFCRTIRSVTRSVAECDPEQPFPQSRSTKLVGYPYPSGTNRLS